MAVEAAPRMTYNRRHGDAPPGSKYIGRPSPLGNPFRIGRDGTRAEVIDKYRVWLKGEIEAGRIDLEPWRGVPRVCWCWPEPCHSGVIGELLGEAPEQNEAVRLL